MKTTMILVVTACLTLIGCNQKPDKDSVNAVIGDISYEKEFGSEPDKSTDEQTRIKTHLKYVEEKLREKDVSDLSPKLRKRRAEMLDFLHDYRTTGEFPVNYNYPNERRPCFIYKNGNICVVGYLIEQTAGRELAEKVLKKSQKLSSDKLKKLLQHLGCTKEELPDFGYYPGQKPNEYLIYETQSDLRDSENVPLSESIHDYFQREVKPHVAEAWINLDKTKIGYEISFNKYFYQHKPLRSIEEVSREIFDLEQENEGLIMDILKM